MTYFASVRVERIEYTDEALGLALVRVANVWEKVQRSHDRFSIYRYLAAVYELGMIWKIEGEDVSRAKRALDLFRISENISEPFAAIIRCSSSRRRVDPKTRSKWTRVLMFAAAAEQPPQFLEDFIRQHGGLNRAAAVFRARLVRTKK